MTRSNGTEDFVGPVLEAGEAARAVISAIQALNPSTEVLDRGAYLRVRVPRRCVVTREAIERSLGRAFLLPGDLECLMPSFQGRFRISEEEAVWSYEEAP
jgi:hypothetical protein